MAGRHRRIKPPRAPRLNPFSRPAPAAPVNSRGRSRAKYGDEGKPARTRVQLEARADARPAHRALGTRESPRDDQADPYGGGRNYPAKGRGRTKDPTANTRAQLATRGAQRDAQGLPASRPHPKSGEGARSAVKAKGRARRPAASLPGDPTPVSRHRPKQPATGREFASAYFGRPPRGTT